MNPNRRTDTSPFDLDALSSRLTELANPDEALAMKAYMRDQFEFFGVKSKPRRDAAKPVMAAVKEASPSELLDFADRCWAQPQREFQAVAVDALRKGAKKFDVSHLDRVEHFIVTKSWWDTIDFLAAHVVGPMTHTSPAVLEVLDRWIDDDNIWRARTAILHQLSFKADTDPVRLFAYAEKRAEDTEFFIRKAIGWALRSHARVDPRSVKAFVDQHDKVLSGLTKREALKHLT